MPIHVFIERRHKEMHSIKFVGAIVISLAVLVHRMDSAEQKMHFADQPGCEDNEEQPEFFKEFFKGGKFRTHCR